METSHPVLVTRDLVSAAAITAALRRLQMRVTHRASLAEAREQLASKQVIDAVIADCEPEEQIPEITEEVQRNRPNISPILIAPRGSRIASVARRAPDVRAVLSKPFGIAELRAAFSREAAPAATGRVRLEGLDLIDVLQILHMNRRYVTVCVEPVGRLIFRDGESVHAEYRGATGWSMGATALAQIVAQGSRALRTTAPTPCPTTIKQPFEHLLLATLTKSDEAAREKSGGARKAQNGS